MASEVIRILVVDDDWMSRELLHAHLTSAGYRVQQANSGEQALAVVFDDPPALVMLDASMPGINGFDVCRALRQDARTRTVPVLMITAFEAESDVQKAREAGANGFVAKPFKAADLLAQVAALLSHG